MIKGNIFSKNIICFCIVLFLLLNVFSSANAACLDSNKLTCSVGQKLVCDEDGDWGCLTDTAVKSTGDILLINPLTGKHDAPNVAYLSDRVGMALNYLVGIVGSLALLMFVYGGFLWMTASGSSEKIQQGKNVLIWATVGIFIIFTLYGLVSFLLKMIKQGGG